MQGAAVVGGRVLLSGCVTEAPAVQGAVSDAVPIAAITAEEILTPLGLMPGSPDQTKV